ncbi:hypothetical protein ACFFLG_08075 [Shewanella indica]|uniref:hypothetical protein n=2 Tax=Shewanellaceae TaxID=267890 RepID=UPI000C32A719|nr:hypothetical protein GCM10007107_09760 [Shewanella indica]
MVRAIRLFLFLVLVIVQSSPSYANDWMEQLKRVYAWREVASLCLDKAPKYQEDWSLMVQLHDKQIIIWQRMIRDELRAALAPEQRATFWFEQLENLAQVWAPTQVRGMDCGPSDLEFLANRMTQDPTFFTAMELVKQERGGR